MRSSPWLLAGLSAAGGLAGMSVSITGPILVDMAHTYRVSEAAVGQLMTLASVAGVASTLAVSPFLDRFGRRKGIAASLACMAVACLDCALAPSFAVLAIGYCFVGLSGYLLYAQVLAAVGDLYDASFHGRAMGWVVFGNMGIPMLGLSAVGQVAQRFGWPWSYAMLAGLAAPAALWAWFVIPGQARRRGPEPGMGYRQAFRALRSSRVAVAMLATLAFMCASAYGSGTYIAVVAKQALGASTAAVGTVSSLRALGSMLFALQAGFLLKRADWRLLTAAGLATALFGLASYLVPVNLLVFAAENLFYGLAIGAIDVGVNATLASADAGGRGAVMAMRSTMDSLGGIVGPALGGLALAAGGYQLAGWLFALLGLGAAIAAAGSAPQAHRT